MANGAGGGDGFITVIDPTQSGSASVTYSSYLGGSDGEDSFNGIAVDSSGNAWMVGQAVSTDFPITSNAYQKSYAGGSGVFVSEINPSASGKASLVYSTLVAGDAGESGEGIGANGSDVFVAGWTASDDFPTTPDANIGAGGCIACDSYPAENGFFLILNPNLSGAKQLVYSTFIGGTAIGYGDAIAVDNSANSYVTGYVQFTGYATTSNAYETTCPLCPGPGGAQNAFLSIFTGPSSSSSTPTPRPSGGATPWTDAGARSGTFDFTQSARLRQRRHRYQRDQRADDYQLGQRVIER